MYQHHLVSYSFEDFCLKCKTQYEKDLFLESLSPEEREERNKELEKKLAYYLLSISSVIVTFIVLLPIFLNVPGDLSIWYIIFLPVDFILFTGALYYRPKSEIIQRFERLENKMKNTEIKEIPIQKREVSNSDLLLRIESLENEVNYLKKIINDKF